MTHIDQPHEKMIMRGEWARTWEKTSVTCYNAELSDRGRREHQMMSEEEAKRWRLEGGTVKY
jgi:hypothetical protein